MASSPPPHIEPLKKFTFLIKGIVIAYTTSLVPFSFFSELSVNCESWMSGNYSEAMRLKKHYD